MDRFIFHVIFLIIFTRSFEQASMTECVSSQTASSRDINFASFISFVEIFGRKKYSRAFEAIFFMFTVIGFLIYSSNFEFRKFATFFEITPSFFNKTLSAG